jgi:hypothetical protein
VRVSSIAGAAVGEVGVEGEVGALSLVVAEVGEEFEGIQQGPAGVVELGQRGSEGFELALEVVVVGAELLGAVIQVGAVVEDIVEEAVGAGGEAVVLVEHAANALEAPCEELGLGGAGGTDGGLEVLDRAQERIGAEPRREARRAVPRMHAVAR